MRSLAVNICVAAHFRTWGDLGLTGEWPTNRSIPMATTWNGNGLFLPELHLQGQRQMNCDLKEFADPKQPGNAQHDAGQRISEALARDRYGIAVLELALFKPAAKDCRPGHFESEPYYTPSKDNLIQRKYLLTACCSQSTLTAHPVSQLIRT